MVCQGLWCLLVSNQFLFFLTTDLITALLFSIDKDPNEPHKFVLTFFHRYNFEADSEEQVKYQMQERRIFQSINLNSIIFVFTSS